MSYTGVLLSDDEDILRYEPNMDEHWPRTDRNGQPKRSWSVQHHLAAEEIQRRFRMRKTMAEPFELGRVSERSRAELKQVATFLALRYMFIAAQSIGDETGFHAKKAAMYLREADAVFDGAALFVDYDTDNSGVADKTEQQQPAPLRFIRG